MAGKDGAGVRPVGQPQGSLRRHRREQLLRHAAARARFVAGERRRVRRHQAVRPHADHALLTQDPPRRG